MDQILFVNSASFVDLSISASLISDVGSNIDFSLSTQVSGSFVGSLQGNATTATTASYSLVTETSISASFATSASVAQTATTAINAQTASLATLALTANTATSASLAQSASYVIGQKVKSGIVSGSAFSGNPQTYNVVFITPFVNDLYSISIVGDNARTWVVDNRSSTGFTISANTKTSVSGFVYWQARVIGEFNS